MYRFLLTCFAAVACFCVHAQTLPSKRYTTADGLISDRLTCMVQDEQGFLWTGSYFGLSRYDGYRFVNIILPHVQQNKYVTALAATDGAVYAGFLFGGGLMEYRQGKATAFTVPAFRGTSFNNVLTLSPHATKGVLVCGSANAVYHFADGRFRFLFTLDSGFLDVSYRHLAMDKNGNIWVATDKGLVVYTASGKLMTVTTMPNFFIQPSGNGIIAVTQNGLDAEMSFIEISNGAFAIKKLGGARTVIPVPQNHFRKEQAWLLDTSGRFINLLAGGRATSFVTKGVVSNDVQFLYSDRENNLWIATHTGLLKMPNLSAGFFPFSEIANGTGNITGHDSALWINNGRYLYLFRHEKMERLDINFTGTLLYTDDQLWIGNYESGLCLVRPDNNKFASARYFTSFGKTKIKVHTITKDAKGGIWAGGENGIFYLKDGKPFLHFQPQLKNGQPAFIVGMAVDAVKGVIWAGDNAGGMMKIRYELSGSVIRHEVQHYIDTSNGLNDGHIRSVLLDSKGAVWVGTRFSGIFRITENNNNLQVHNLSAQAGMKCTRVTDVREIAGKSVWMATCNGVFEYLHDSGKWNAYTTADGLQESEIFANYVSSNGKHCWAVSATGVTTLELTEKKQVPPPLVNLTRITVLGREDSTAIFNQEASAYRPDESSIGFQFAASSYTDERKLWYRYRLEGYDKDWSLPTQSNSVNYASLPPGSYTFRVLASVDLEKWSAVPAEFKFTIQKPFYKSPLFFVLVLVALMAGFYFFHTYRLRQKLKLERMRTRISADLHDDIGSTLSSISIISEGALQEKDLAASKIMLREISENTQSLMDKMDDIIWCVNPQNDSFQNLMLRIQKFASALFEAKGIDYSINIDRRISEIALPMDQRQHIYLILKEAVNNLVKYSAATHATISMNHEGGFLEMTVSDNGKGFDAEKQVTGNGLRNMKRRAAMMQAMLRITGSDQGTVVFLRSKIK